MLATLARQAHKLIIASSRVSARSFTPLPLDQGIASLALPTRLLGAACILNERTFASSTSSGGSLGKQKDNHKQPERETAAAGQGASEIEYVLEDFTGFAGMRGDQRLYFVQGFEEPVTMEEILTGTVDLGDDFHVGQLGDHTEASLVKPDLVERYLSDNSKSRGDLIKEKLRGIRQENARSKRDTGSPEIQIAQWTTKIKLMSEHLREHKKDKHSRRGLYKWLSRRRRMLKFLHRKDYERYINIITKLELKDHLSNLDAKN